MNIFYYINNMHSGDHPELWNGAGIFLQAMREEKVRLAHFILVALGDDVVNGCVEIEGVSGRTLLMCSAELTQPSARACFMQLLLGRGAGVERRDEAGQTALSLASQHGHLDAVRLLLLNGAQTDTPDNEGRRPLDYAAQEHHGKVVKFLLKASRRQEIKDKHEDFTLSGSMEKLASWQPENRPKTLHGAFLSGLRRLLCKQSVCDLFMTEHVICNPYALEHDEEKRLKGHRKYPGGIFQSSAQLAIPDHVTKNSTFFPAWMKNGPTCHFDSILKTNSSFWRWMTPKMFLNCTDNESQINLLVPDEDAESLSSTAEEMPFTDQIEQNHRFLDEGSENFLGFERMDRRNSLSSERKLPSHVHVPKSENNYFHLFAQCNQNYVCTTSHVFGTHRRHTYPELRLFLRDSETDLQALVSEDQP